jgi:hypothetical protein
MWVQPELKDPVLRHHPTRKSVGYFGAVRLRDGNSVSQRLNRGLYNGSEFEDEFEFEDESLPCEEVYLGYQGLSLLSFVLS